MLTPQFPLPVHDEITVDLFAGGRGASTGIEQAIGRPVDVAIKAFDLPADCRRCTHFEMGDCKKHAAAVPKEFQEQAEACADWQFDGIPF